MLFFNVADLPAQGERKEYIMKEFVCQISGEKTTVKNPDGNGITVDLDRG